MTKKISELTEDTSPAPTSQIELNVGGASRRSTLANLLIELIASSAQGDVLYNNGTTWVRLAAGTAGQFLQTGGASANPSWSNTLLENVAIILDAALSADGKYSGVVEAGTAGTTLAFGDIVYLAVADSRWELTDADAAATAGPVKIGMVVLAAAADGDPTTILLYGKVRADAVFPALTIGAPVYIGTTAGDVQTTAPSGTLDIVRIVGYGNTADELFFCPDPSFIELV